LKSILGAAVFALVLPTVAQAQAGLTGQWQGETRNGSRIVLDLTATKTDLTGTLTRNDESTPITDGKVSKNTFTFKATLAGQNETVSGELGEDQLSVWLERQGRESAIVLKRVQK
jgi:hypothetical protein